MKTRRYSGEIQRKILAGIIFDDEVCRKVAAVWRPEGLFDEDKSNQVARIAVEHFRNHGVAPADAMTTAFQSWASTANLPEETARSLEAVLAGVYDVVDEIQPGHIIDLAGRYFERVRVVRLTDEMRGLIENDKIDEAHERAKEVLRKVNVGNDSYVEPIGNPDVWFGLGGVERRRGLVQYKEDFGAFIGDSFARGTFHSWMAPDKTGKTTWLVDAMYRAVRGRCRVAYFDTGDSSVEEVLQRLAIRATRTVLHEGDTSQQVPYLWDGDEPAYSTKIYETVDFNDAGRALSKITSKKSPLRVAAYPNSSLSVSDLDDKLKEWELGGWVPDVVIVDYADIMAPPRGVRDTLDQIDETWKRMRRLSQEWHVLLLTATQTAASAYSKGPKELLSRSDFGGRKTKLAHVNGMLGINVSAAEKDKSMARINWIVRRGYRSNEKEFCAVAGCLAAGDPVMCSRWGRLHTPENG